MDPAVENFIRLVPLGFLVGIYSALVGTGGGFLIVPLLLIMFPAETPDTLTSISLAVVFFTAYAGTLTYARMGRIDYFYGMLFALAGIPGIILGTTAVEYVPKRHFTFIVGFILLGLGFFLVKRPTRKRGQSKKSNPKKRPKQNPEPKQEPEQEFSRRLPILGAVASGYIGVISGFLGIGGGIIRVPFMVHVMRFRPHIATATSLFALSIVAFTGIVSKAVRGAFFTGIDKTMYLAVGVMMGAPLGAALSTKFRGPALVRLLAIALCAVGIKLIRDAVMD